MSFTITDSAAAEIKKAFEAGGNKNFLIRVAISRNEDLKTLDHEMYDIDPSEVTDEDVLTEINGIHVAVAKQVVHFFDGVRLDFMVADGNPVFFFSGK